jgi:hypothetical protein
MLRPLPVKRQVPPGECRGVPVTERQRFRARPGKQPSRATVAPIHARGMSRALLEAKATLRCSCRRNCARARNRSAAAVSSKLATPEVVDAGAGNARAALRRLAVPDREPDRSRVQLTTALKKRARAGAQLARRWSNSASPAELEALAVGTAPSARPDPDGNGDRCRDDQN